MFSSSFSSLGSTNCSFVVAMVIESRFRGRCFRPKKAEFFDDDDDDDVADDVADEDDDGEGHLWESRR